MRFLKKGSRYVVVAAQSAFFALAAMGIAALLTVRALWGDVSMEQVLFHLAVPLEGGIDANLRRVVVFAASCAAAVSALFVLLALYCRVHGKRWASGVLVLAAAALVFFAERDLGVSGYVARQFQSTAIFDGVPAASEVRVDFPGAKRNLLVIHMESIEETFNDAGIMGAALLPELARLQRENVHFEGFRQVRGTEWTTAGMTAAFFGLPLLLPIGPNDYGGYASFLPGAASLFEVLERSGYAMEFLFPNDCSFGGIRNMVATHAPRAVVKDLLWFNRFRGDAEANRGNGWGVRDRYLYERLKEDLALRAAGGRPFAFFLKTVDTHVPDTYYFADPDVHAPERFHDFRDALRASSVMASELVDWIEEQDFAKDLTIVILGDHLWMGSSVAGRPLGDNRAVYNVFINPAVSPESSGARVFSTPDFAPSILEAIGARLPDRRFGIGTSLFSARKTTFEELGEEKYVSELGKNSARYRKFFESSSGTERTALAIESFNDFSSNAAAAVIFPRSELFMRRGGGSFRFVIDNRSSTTISSAADNAVRLRASLFDAEGRAVPGCVNVFDLPRDMPPGDMEWAQGFVPLPEADGTYLLRVEFVTKDGVPAGPEGRSVPMTLAARWLWERAPCGAVQTERAVRDEGVPLAAFPGVMEVYYHGGTLFYKLLDRRLSAGDIFLRGKGVSRGARGRRRSECDSCRWAGAPADGLPPERSETGFSRAGESAARTLCLLPAFRDAALREEENFADYVKKLVSSDYLVLASCSDDFQNSFLLGARGGRVFTAGRGEAPLHFDGERDGLYVDLNAYSAEETAASPSGMRLSLRVSGVEGAAFQRGLNFAVYDTARREFIDRAAFEFHGSFEAIGDLFAGRISFADWAASLVPGSARLIGHKPPDRGIPVERGAVLASWNGGPYVVRYQGEIWFQTPLEQAFKIRLVCGPDGAAREFAPTDCAVSSSFDGVLSRVPESQGWDAAEIGFVTEDGRRFAERADLTPLFLETDFNSYLRRLNNPDYAVFISVLYDGAKRLTETHKKLFAALGLEMSLLGRRRWGYAAVSDGGVKLFEKCDRKRIDATLAASGVEARLVSTGEEAGFESSVTLDGEEFSARSLGMNIVVCDKKEKRVIDSVCFSTFSDFAASRKDARFRRRGDGE